MFWYCDICNDWGLADGEVDAAVDRQLHLDTHRRPQETPEPPQESEDTVLNAKYAAWGTTLLLGLLSARWHVLAGVVPFAALIAFVLTYHEGHDED